MYKRLAYLLSSKRSEAYSRTINWIRCTIGFALLDQLSCAKGLAPPISTSSGAAQRIIPPWTLQSVRGESEQSSLTLLINRTNHYFYYLFPLPPHCRCSIYFYNMCCIPSTFFSMVITDEHGRRLTKHLKIVNLFTSVMSNLPSHSGLLKKYMFMKCVDEWLIFTDHDCILSLCFFV